MTGKLVTIFYLLIATVWWKMSKIIKTEKVLEKFKLIHGDFYNYSKVIYTGSNGIIKIICPVHGEFEQKARKHLEGQGCPGCGKERHRKATTKTTEEFILEAKEIHGDRYDYSKSIYVGVHQPVTIICKVHGEFQQSPGNHLGIKQGGCSKCVHDTLRMTTAQFIESARNIHGDRYDYSLVDYTNMAKEVVIICKKHGQFLQRPGTHLYDKSGCPTCGGFFSRMFPMSVYFLVSDDFKYIKVGVTRNLLHRIRALLSAAAAKHLGFNSFLFTHCLFKDGYKAAKLEKDFKDLFSPNNAGWNIPGYGGSTEWFNLTEEMLGWIKTNVDPNADLKSLKQR